MINLLASRSQFDSVAKQIAADMNANFIYFSKHNSPRYAADFIEREVTRLGFTFPVNKSLLKKSPEEAQACALARCFDVSWWRRQMLKSRARNIERTNIELGLVNRNTGLYISEDMFQEKCVQARCNKDVLESLEIENELGEILSLSDVVDSSMSNPRLRRTELMVRLSGFEKIADELGHQGVFLTLTTPSKYHAYHSKPCQPNSKYQNLSPLDGQRHLNILWQRARAKLKRNNIEIYGFRIVEPHHDGTPHWHLLLFSAQENISPLLDTLREYALAEDADEPGANKHRFKVFWSSPTGHFPLRQFIVDR